MKDLWQNEEAWVAELFLLSQDNLHQEVDQDAIKQSFGAEPLLLSLQILLPRLSKDVSADFRSGRYPLDALMVGIADKIMIERILVALFSFQAIASSNGFENHIDDYV